MVFVSFSDEAIQYFSWNIDSQFASSAKFGRFMAKLDATDDIISVVPQLGEDPEN